MNPRYLPFFVARGNILWELRCRAIVRQSDVVTATNEPMLQHLRREFPSHADRIVLTPLSSSVPEPPDGEDRQQVRQRLGIAPEEVLLLYFGFLRPDKRVELVLEAFAALASEGLPVRLLVIASRGEVGEVHEEYYAELRRRFESLDANGRARWCDYLPSDVLASHLMAADIALLPLSDGVSWRRTSFLACLRHSLALVTTRGDHTPAEMQDGVHALLVSPDDLKALTDAARRLVVDPHLRQSLRVGARTLYESRDWNQVVQSTLASYDLALSTHQRDRSP